MRIEEVYFGKAKDVVGELRSKLSLFAASSSHVLICYRSGFLVGSKQGARYPAGDDYVHAQVVTGDCQRYLATAVVTVVACFVSSILRLPTLHF